MDSVIIEKRNKQREYQNNYVKNRKAVDEEYRLRLQTRTNQYIKQKLQTDEEFRIRYTEQARIRKRNHAEKVKNERIELYKSKIANYDKETGDMKEYFRMCRYIARYGGEDNSD
jgi:hypothetical protein